MALLVHGNGNIGAKGRGLVERRDDLARLGLPVIPGTIIASSNFTRVFQRIQPLIEGVNGREGLKTLIEKPSWTQEDARKAYELCREIECALNHKKLKLHEVVKIENDLANVIYPLVQKQEYCYSLARCFAEDSLGIGATKTIQSCAIDLYTDVPIVWSSAFTLSYLLYCKKAGLPMPWDTLPAVCVTPTLGFRLPQMVLPMPLLSARLRTDDLTGGMVIAGAFSGHVLKQVQELRASGQDVDWKAILYNVDGDSLEGHLRSDILYNSPGLRRVVLALAKTLVEESVESVQRVLKAVKRDGEELYAEVVWGMEDENARVLRLSPFISQLAPFTKQPPGQVQIPSARHMPLTSVIGTGEFEFNRVMIMGASSPVEQFAFLAEVFNAVSARDKMLIVVKRILDRRHGMLDDPSGIVADGVLECSRHLFLTLEGNNHYAPVSSGGVWAHSDDCFDSFKGERAVMQLDQKRQQGKLWLE